MCAKLDFKYRKKHFIKLVVSLRPCDFETWFARASPFSGSGFRQFRGRVAFSCLSAQHTTFSREMRCVSLFLLSLYAVAAGVFGSENRRKGELKDRARAFASITEQSIVLQHPGSSTTAPRVEDARAMECVTPRLHNVAARQALSVPTVPHRALP